MDESGAVHRRAGRSESLTLYEPEARFKRPALSAFKLRPGGRGAFGRVMIRADLMSPAIEILLEAGDWPAEAELRALSERAVEAALAAVGAPPPSRTGEEPVELSILFTDNAAIQRLNAQYRGKDKPTNVLAFPQSSGPLLGDIVLAYETVRDEAALAGKPFRAHMAHLIIHGFLHLLGYDHGREDEAETMEALEREALEKIGIADPYATRSD